MKNYYLTMNGVTILCDENTVSGWIEYVLDSGQTPVIEKVEAV